MNLYQAGKEFEEVANIAMTESNATVWIVQPDGEIIVLKKGFKIASTETITNHYY